MGKDKHMVWFGKTHTYLCALVKKEICINNGCYLSAQKKIQVSTNLDEEEISCGALVLACRHFGKEACQGYIGFT